MEYLVVCGCLISLKHIAEFRLNCLPSIYFELHVNLKLFSTFEQPYVELANSYGTGQIEELEAYARANAEKFESVRSFTYLSFHLKHRPF